MVLIQTFSWKMVLESLPVGNLSWVASRKWSCGQEGLIWRRLRKPAVPWSDGQAGEERGGVSFGLFGEAELIVYRIQIQKISLHTLTSSYLTRVVILIWTSHAMKGRVCFQLDAMQVIPWSALIAIELPNIPALLHTSHHAKQAQACSVVDDCRQDHNRIAASEYTINIPGLRWST